jgi:hypoxanthine phosphoribosyltransferase
MSWTVDDKTIISFNDIIEHVDNFITQCSDAAFEYDYIIPIQRGGNIPATLISYKMKINKLIPINAELFNPKTNNVKDKVTVQNLDKSNISRLNNVRRILLVDDIYDTGATLTAVVEYLKTVLKDTVIIDTYTVFYKPSGMAWESDFLNGTFYSSKTIPDDNWLVFPWDEEYHEYMKTTTGAAIPSGKLEVKYLEKRSEDNNPNYFTVESLAKPEVVVPINSKVKMKSIDNISNIKA